MFSNFFVLLIIFFLIFYRSASSLQFYGYVIRMSNFTRTQTFDTSQQKRQILTNQCTGICTYAGVHTEKTSIPFPVKSKGI